MDDITFYVREGKMMARRKGGISKERMMKDPAFKRVRENQSEFSGAAKVGKALRLGMSSVIDHMSDSRVSARLTGLMKRLCARGGGRRGTRPFEIATFGSMLKGFELNRHLPFTTVFKPLTTGSFSGSRKEYTWVIPDFDTDRGVRASYEATHFKLVLSLSTLSDYQYNPALKGYEPVNPDENLSRHVVTSQAIPIGGVVGADTTLVADLPITSALPASVGVIAATGIEFYKEEGGIMYALGTDNAMEIREVG